MTELPCKYQCKVCDVIYDSLVPMLKHKKTIHDNSSEFKVLRFSTHCKDCKTKLDDDNRSTNGRQCKTCFES